MLLMTESGIRDCMCNAVYRHAKANNKYMKSYNKSIKSSYLVYLDANNLYGRSMLQKLPIGDFKLADDLSKYTASFIKNYDENSDYGSILEVEVKYPKNLHKLPRDLPFLSERMKINKYSKFTCTLNDK